MPMPSFIYLSIYFAKLPNNCLNRYWYKDKAMVKKLKFVKTEFKFIDTDAFNQRQFLNLIELEFKYNSIMSIEFKVGALKGLKKLKTFILNTIGEVILNYTFLELVVDNLEQLLLNSLGSSNLFNLIGSLNLRKVRSLVLTKITTYRVITQNTITNMDNLKYLKISACSIEAISNDAFDRIGNKLTALDLTKNNLKTLPINLFDHLHGLNLTFEMFLGNPIECTCDILYLDSKFQNVFHNICEAERNSNQIENCPGKDALIPVGRSIESRYCVNHFGTNTVRITYPIMYRQKFNASDVKLNIRSPTRSIFRLIIFNNELQLSINCVTFISKYAVVFLNSLRLKTGATTICIIDKLDGVIWPLNCISINISPFNAWVFLKDKTMICFGFSMILLFTIFVSMYLGKLLVQYNLILLTNINFVALQRKFNTNKIEKAFIVPKDWTKFQKIRWLRSMKYAKGLRANQMLNTNYKLSIMAGEVIIEENIGEPCEMP